MIQLWGKKGKGDWNEYWRLDRVLRAQPQLEAELAELGIPDVYLCPNLWKPRDPETLLDIEVFIPPGAGVASADPRIAELFKHIANVWVGPSPAETLVAFQDRCKQHLLYRRQRFELWDEQVPRFILGLDFDQGLRNFNLCPAEPEKWRMVDHNVDGVNCDRRVLPAMLLDPTDKGRALLEDLEKTFDYWHPGAGHNYRMPLNDVLAYREVLLRYGVDCNEAFRDGLVEGWYPIDIGEKLSSETIRTLCSTPLPDHLADLLAGDLDGGTGRNYIHFEFAALTDN